MKRNIISIAAAGVLTTAISVLAAGSPAAFAAPFNGVSGEGYRCESGSRDPDPIPYNDSGSMRAIAQNNTVNPEFTDGISRFSYRVFLPLLRDSRENMNFSPVSLYYALAQASEGAGETPGPRCWRLWESAVRHLTGLSLRNRPRLCTRHSLRPAWRLPADVCTGRYSGTMKRQN